MIVCLSITKYWQEMVRLCAVCQLVVTQLRINLSPTVHHKVSSQMANLEKLHQMSVERLFEKVEMRQEPVTVSDSRKVDLSIISF